MGYREGDDVFGGREGAYLGAADDLVRVARLEPSREWNAVQCQFSCSDNVHIAFAAGSQAHHVEDVHKVDGH